VHEKSRFFGSFWTAGLPAGPHQSIADLSAGWLLDGMDRDSDSSCKHPPNENRLEIAQKTGGRS
jgi:hypothetical protein